MAFSRGVLAVPLALVAVAVAGPLTATADPPAPPPPPAANQPSGSGYVASVNATIQGRPINVARLGNCDTDAAPVGFTRGVQTFLVNIGWGTSVCRTDERGNVDVEVTGAVYFINVLRPFGGPPLRIGRYTVTCSASPSGTASTMRVSNILGAWLPNPVPPNYTMVIPGRLPTDAPLARIVLNEQVRAPAPDRSLTVNAVHVQLSPSALPNSGGDFVAGSVHCSPGSR
ncbi:MAG TPA: choice-of-anchor P family protein [Actinophytocola sp.]|uniref:choice-of-anchor P family protein n=1 Tax=Actinophytocola sp. TaxID=1872138 RepID=UPI002DBCF819|nr:choice-of-anchor P family protein [Actinophytocola sp.]HEU5475656.1 choice-of-anchor P family protein [Actinophytocola sp.]